MSKLTSSVLTIFLAALFVLTTSSVPAPKTAKAPSTNLSAKQMYSLVEQQTGSELRLKDKIALKVFNKKINKSLDKAVPPGGGKSHTAAILLALFVGGLGIHRFYLGYTWQGVVQLLTLGGFGIWALIDLIRIITGDLQPKNGSYTSKG
jgi:TM2 domain-containing membrane protein YozV